MNAAASALRDFRDLPGPRRLPLLGNLLQVEAARVHRDVEAWQRQYGPLFRIQFGLVHMLVVSDHETIGQVLRERPDTFGRPPRIEQLGREMGLLPGVFNAGGEDWRRQRRMVMAGFDPSHVKAYFPSLLRVTQRLHGRWLRAAHEQRVLDLQAELMRYTVDAISGLAFGSDINTLESDEDVIQRHLDRIFPMLFRRIMSAAPWWRVWRTTADRELERSVVALNAAIAGFIAAARQRLDADPARRGDPPNLLEAMIVAADREDSGVSDTDVAGNVLTMLLAGEDTTANSLAWMIWLLRRHPDALRRAGDEVRRLTPEVAGFTPERLASLRYLDACVHETMRLKPVAPFQVLEALRDTVVADVRIPAGVQVWCLMRGDSLSERHFRHAEAFQPERWLGDETGTDPAAGSAKRISMPFGGGPRICPGRYLALLEIKMAMAMLLAHFDILDVTAPDGGEAQEHMSFTMMPLGLKMRLAAR